ncbi:MAG: aldo/keto reductase [Thermoplasmata archaeon]|nr:aldo/keto reductase [Candidatus Sysuiplasma acidicola]MBX8645549.1 aldo/keto reductase [Candidatus Sysuiplasma acidicola]MDH2904949.1 aldo/keto reductase [Methanomassiliicoccales archaeon]
MEYREFGRTGVRVSCVGMGTYYDFRWIAASALGIGFGVHEKVTAIRKGIEEGINLIDTAEFYRSEPLVSRAIKDYDREKLFIATKVFPNHLREDKLIRACDRSLRRLGISYIDLYQIHFPSFRVPVSESMRAMERLVDDGKIRYIGVSNFSLQKMIEAEQSLKRHSLISTQMHYNLKHRDVENDILPHCRENGIALMAYYPLGHGKLAELRSSDAATVKAIASKCGLKTDAQLALNYLLSSDKCVFPIPRASNPEHVAENSTLGGRLFDREDMNALAAIFSNDGG